MKNIFCEPYSWHDPFDIWATPQFGKRKSNWYQGRRLSKLILYTLYFIDLIIPTTLRYVLATSQHCFPHTLALLQNTPWSLDNDIFLKKIEALSKDNGWGLPFAWYSINGVYPPSLPLITVSPYVMRALLNMIKKHGEYPQAEKIFHDSWFFLESLIPQVDTEKHLALTYASFDDKVTVVNANTYACWAYAMHATHGRSEIRSTAKGRAIRLANWVLDQQNQDGSWFYLSQRGNWDMIDGFHSCFVVRNLRSAGKLVPEIEDITKCATKRGWAYIQTYLFDPAVGFCRRYSVSHRYDPFQYDIYDQAEYLGLLIDHGELSAARKLIKLVESRFKKNGHWYCRIDMLGRLWGRDFMRWGIVPFIHQRARIKRSE